VRPPLDASGRDGLRAANRFTFNVENTHPNDGSLIDEGVFDHLAGLGTVLHQRFGWVERTLGHRTWTRRKPVDPWFRPGGLVALQDEIQQILGGDMWASDITDRTWMAMFHSGVPKVVGFGRYYCSNDGTYDWAVDPLEGLAAPWGSNPHPTAPDGAGDYASKINALNYLLSGFAEAAGTT
ncbi:hypothetical protein LCGC14_2242980, partial [marine sediment metagenome]